MNDLLIIAEVGINHNGDVETAKQLIRMAKDCGCDAVKFQKRTVDAVYTPEFLAGHRDSPWGNTQRAQKEGLELDFAAYCEIDLFCKETEIDWFASAWDIESQNFLKRFDLPYNKVASAMLTNRVFIDRVAAEGKRTFISTGMSTDVDIDVAVDIFNKYGTPFTLLHCVSTYPCDDADCNLLMIQTLGEKYGCPVGYSGHERGVLPSVLAVALGATVIERHITLDRTSYGSDQAASLERKGLELLVRDCRDVYKMLGDGIKRVIPAEADCARKLRYWDAN